MGCFAARMPLWGMRFGMGMLVLAYKPFISIGSEDFLQKGCEKHAKTCEILNLNRC